MLAFAGLSALLAGLYPIGFAVTVVCLFAGPHNWVELRYLMQRMPRRWGPLRPYYLLAGGGILALTAGSIGLTVAAWNALLPIDLHHGLASAWAACLVAWILGLIHLREDQNPRRDWLWVRPIAGVSMAFAWCMPGHFTTVLVYVHPLVSLWILDRELVRLRSPLLTSFRRSLPAIPLLVLGLWVHLGAQPNLVPNSQQELDILRHSGAHLVQGISGQFLVASHAFLEVLHYGVWLLAFPLIGGGARRLFDTSRLAGRFPAFTPALRLALAFSTLTVLGLWIAFSLDPGWTRQMYFTVAIVHVLVEVPALLRML